MRHLRCFYRTILLGKIEAFENMGSRKKSQLVKEFLFGVSLYTDLDLRMMKWRDWMEFLLESHSTVEKSYRLVYSARNKL